jgi:signal transduction histidine kinase/CheY-like chemotaxis protein
MGGSLPHGRRAMKRIVALAVLILAIVVVGGLGLLAYASIAVDGVQVREERAMVQRRIDRALAATLKGVTTAAVWDQSYTHLKPGLDLAWADTEIGAYYSENLGHSLSVVIGPDDKNLYGWSGKRRMTAAEAETFLRDAAPMVAKVRAAEAIQQALDHGPAPIGLEGALTESGIVASGGDFYLTGVSSVVPRTLSRGPERTSLVISALRMDAPFMASLDRDVGVLNSVIVPHSGKPRPASVPVVDINGYVVGDMVWTPKTPGLQVLREAVPVFATALLVLLVAGLALTARIRAIFRELAANDGALDRTMEDLVRARDQAAAASVAKSRFLANMSHEIRTPLNGILGMTQVMARDELSDGQRQRLDVVRDSGQTLLSVLNDILDISKIEAGKLEMDNHEFDVAEAVYTVCNAFAGIADQKDVAFRIEVEPELRGLWFGDGTRLRQVIANLVSNAVKFTSQGEVSITATRSGTQKVRFVVADSGIGIPAESLGDLFQKFSQVDASTTRRFGGTGLGLAISRELVELMGGWMTVASEEGKGSTFTFELPLEYRSAEPPKPHLAESLEPLDAEGRRACILAAEDNPTNQLILKSLLEPFGVDLHLVVNGAQAVEAFGTTRFDLILMDVQMPEMNGVEATAAIRALEAERGLPAIPILALSANVMSHQVKEYLDAGMNGFIPKPIEAAKLFAAIDAALSAAEDAESVAA